VIAVRRERFTRKPATPRKKAPVEAFPRSPAQAEARSSGRRTSQAPAAVPRATHGGGSPGCGETTRFRPARPRPRCRGAPPPASGRPRSPRRRLSSPCPPLHGESKGAPPQAPIDLWTVPGESGLSVPSMPPRAPASDDPCGLRRGPTDGVAAKSASARLRPRSGARLDQVRNLRQHVTGRSDQSEAFEHDNRGCGGG
jgi:hypothetical protein